MNKVTFSEERRGYNKEEVEKYIAILQKGVADIDNELKEKEEECEGIYKNLEEFNSKIKAGNNLLEKERREKELLKKQIATDGGIKKELESYKRQYQNLESEKKSLTEKIADMIRENETCNQAVLDMTANNRIPDNSKEMEHLTEENKRLNDMVEKLTGEKATWEKAVLEKEKTEQRDNKEEMPDMDWFSGIFDNAKKEADVYLSAVKKQMDEKEKEADRKIVDLMEKAQAEAEVMRNEAKEIKAGAKQEVIDYIAKIQSEEAEILEDARLEAESMKREAKVKLDLTSKKEERLMQRANERASKVIQAVSEDYTRFREMQAQSMKEYQELFAYIGSSLNIQELSDLSQTVKNEVEEE